MSHIFSDRLKPEFLKIYLWQVGKKNQLLNCLLKASLLLQFQPFLWIDCFKVWEIYFTELDGLSEGGENSGQVFNTPFPDRFPAVSTFTTLQLFPGFCLISIMGESPYFGRYTPVA